jgi:hypothetical protein
MSSKKKKGSIYVQGVGNRTKKRSGTITTSLRLSVADNKRLHLAAKADNRSFNAWAYVILSREADRILAREAKMMEKTIG